MTTRWQVVWTQYPGFGQKIQRFTGFGHYPPRPVRVLSFEHKEMAPHKISHIAELQYQDSLDLDLFTMHGTFHTQGSKRLVSYEAVSLASDGDLKRPISVEPVCMDFLIESDHMRLLRGQDATYTLFKRLKPTEYW